MCHKKRSYSLLLSVLYMGFFTLTAYVSEAEHVLMQIPIFHHFLVYCLFSGMALHANIAVRIFRADYPAFDSVCCLVCGLLVEMCASPGNDYLLTFKESLSQRLSASLKKRSCTLFSSVTISFRKRTAISVYVIAFSKSFN